MTWLSTVFFVFAPTMALAATGQTYTETFDNQQNEFGWSFGRPMHFGMREDDSQQGSYLFTDDLVDFSPFVSTTKKTNSPFIGNFKQRRVKAISVDVKLLASESSPIERPLSLELVSDNGTPNNPNDDWAIYTLSTEFVPESGEGWKTFRFEIDSQSTTMPANWSYVPYGQQSPAQPNWGKLLANVTEIGFRIGDPSLFYFLMGWKVGIDNPSIETE